jgi:elongation of very long chain fatty acids protein 4
MDAALTSLTALLGPRFDASYRASYAAYRSRLADGSQPPPPAFVSTAGPALAFLDYRDTRALMTVNAAYLCVVGALFLLMRRRSAPFELKWTMVAYNAVCVALALYVVLGVAAYKLQRPGGFVCNALDGSPAGAALSSVLWAYYAQKFLEYGDTLLFVLRKSFRQLTFLHLYHHVSITLVTAAFLRYDVNGDTYLPALANSCVHVLMYSHYLLSAFGVSAWWKKQLTLLQLLQFACVAAQSLYSLAAGPACGFPDWLKLLMVAYQASMLALFGLFFASSYLQKGEQRRLKKAGGAKKRA